jgi:predicted Zn-dependent protease
LILHDAGYNPIEAARFFEKLEAQGGQRGAVAQFFSSHPNPGNRRRAIEDLIRDLPRREYPAADARAFARAKEAASRISIPKQQGAAAGGRRAVRSRRSR